MDGEQRPDDPPASQRRFLRRGRPDYHNPLKGVAGAAPTYSALTLRLVLAVFGFLFSMTLAIWLWIIDAPAWPVVALVLLALVAVVDLAVVARRKRRGEPG